MARISNNTFVAIADMSEQGTGPQGTSINVQRKQRVPVVEDEDWRIGNAMFESITIDSDYYVYAVDIIIDSEYYQEWFEHELLPTIERKMPLLESSGVIVQQDCASPHTGKGTEEKLNRIGKGGGRNIQLVR